MPEAGSRAVLGVDDFAFRRGHTYGTVLIDMHTRRPVDLLDDRLAETFADWLRAHPGVQIICRDRAGSYAEGGRLGAPDAIQLADRWHLLHNLSDAVDRVARSHRVCLRRQIGPKNAEPPASGPPPSPPQVSGRRAESTRERHGEVHALLAQGMSQRMIGKHLGLQRNTVRRYARTAPAAELLTQNPRRGSQLDPFADYLAMRWEQDCTNAVELTAEIRRRGYRGSERSVRDLVSAGAQARSRPPPLRSLRRLLAR